jgi:hypothetical protein
MVLFSLISLGTKYGNRAEEGTIAISQAQSLMDECIAGFAGQEFQEETKGVLPSDPPRSFRISITPFEIGGSKTKGDVGSNKIMSTNLYRISVELYQSQGQLASEGMEPMCQLTRLVRREPAKTEDVSLANGSRTGGGASR